MLLGSHMREPHDEHHHGYGFLIWFLSIVIVIWVVAEAIDR